MLTPSCPSVFGPRLPRWRRASYAAYVANADRQNQSARLHSLGGTTPTAIELPRRAATS